jgi:hypothetical protein
MSLSGKLHLWKLVRSMHQLVHLIVKSTLEWSRVRVWIRSAHELPAKRSSRAVYCTLARPFSSRAGPFRMDRVIPVPLLSSLSLLFLSLFLSLSPFFSFSSFLLLRHKHLWGAVMGTSMVFMNL